MGWCVDVLMYIYVLMCWCVDVLMCWCVDDCVNVLMCWCVDVLMCVNVLMCWWLCWCVDVFDVFDVFDVLMCWCVDVLMIVLMWWLMCWCVDVLMLMIVLMCWCVGVLMCWCVDDLLCWCVDVLLCWCVDMLMIVLMCWCVDVSTRKKNRYSNFWRGKKITILNIYFFSLTIRSLLFGEKNRSSIICIFFPYRAELLCFFPNFYVFSPFRYFFSHKNRDFFSPKLCSSAFPYRTGHSTRSPENLITAKLTL